MGKRNVTFTLATKVPKSCHVVGWRWGPGLMLLCLLTTLAVVTGNIVQARDLSIVADIGDEAARDPSTLFGTYEVEEPVVSVATGSLKQRAMEAYGQLPVYFIANQGQTDESVQYYVQQGGANIYFTAEEVVMAMDETILRLQFLDANPATDIVGTHVKRTRVNYFIGNDPAKWRTNIATYGEIRYVELYQGVDLIYTGRMGELKHSFVVRPGAEVEDIRLAYVGVDGVRVAENGDLVVETVAGKLRDAFPYGYQEIEGERVEVDTAFRLYDACTYGFMVGAYDPRYSLVIDPALTYSTCLGGSNDDSASDIAVDGSGRAYVTGYTTSTDFPTANPLQPAYAGDHGDVFVSVLNGTGSELVYSTYLGGSGADGGHGIAVGGFGQVYVTGNTWSTDFPTVSSLQPARAGQYDTFVAVLNGTGSELVYSTYLGGSNDDRAHGIAVDGSGQAYVTGGTSSGDFPTANPLQLVFAGDQDAFVAVLNGTGSELVYSTYLGGSGSDSGYGIAVDGSGQAYVTGETRSLDFPTASPLQLAKTDGYYYDAFVAVLNGTGSELVYSTYLGGSDGDSGSGIAVDRSGNAYVTGSTRSRDFPIASPLQPAHADGWYDVFVAVLNGVGSGLVYSTYLGGSGWDLAFGIAVDDSGQAYVTGWTGSSDFPTTSPLQPALAGDRDAFVAVFNGTGSELVYSTYLGGSGADGGHGIAVDGSGQAYVTGETWSGNFPTVIPLQPANAGGRDAFVAKLALVPTPTPTPTSTAIPTPTPTPRTTPTPFTPVGIAVQGPWPGDRAIRGVWDARCVGTTIIATDQDGTVVGEGVIQPDGSFIIDLVRPLETGDVITLSGQCGESVLLHVMEPVPIPEPATLLLLGNGLVALAGYVWSRTRRSNGEE